MIRSKKEKEKNPVKSRRSAWESKSPQEREAVLQRLAKGRKQRGSKR